MTVISSSISSVQSPSFRIPKKSSPQPKTPMTDVTPTRNILAPPNSLLVAFLKSQAEIQAHKVGEPVVITGHNLSIADVVFAARVRSSQVLLDSSPSTRERVDKSQAVIDKKLEDGISVYGVSTGYGGSADTRTNDHLSLGKALLQHQQCGVLPSGSLLASLDSASSRLPLTDPMAGNTMPESWVRAAMLIRMNSLIRGHSGVRWKCIESLGNMLKADIVPLVPLRGSISASGDLSPLSYVAGALTGNPSIRVYSSLPNSAGSSSRTLLPSAVALKEHGLKPLVLSPKEHLGLLNGTAFSAAVGSLVIHEAMNLAVLAQVLTALGTEALLGTQASHHPFIHQTARPHPTQIQAAGLIYKLLDSSSLASPAKEVDVTIEQDAGELRQDRYSLRTSPQWIGPCIEELGSAFVSIGRELNSTTDNPLIDGENNEVHHGGNFQALAVTVPLEKTRLSLFLLGKMLFAQSTEMTNPMLSRGLPPNLASTDPSLNYAMKGLDIASAAYVSELGSLSGNVSSFVQSAEMGNQSLNSLALISARATVNSVEVLGLLSATYLYILCQALDLRAMHLTFLSSLSHLLKSHLKTHFPALPASQIHDIIFPRIKASLDATTNMDAFPRMMKVLESSTTPLLDFILSASPSQAHLTSQIPKFRKSVAQEAAQILQQTRSDYILGKMGPAPAANLLGGTRPLYEFVRIELGVRMHGRDNLRKFEGERDRGVGESVSIINEAIKDGRMAQTVADVTGQFVKEKKSDLGERFWARL